MSEKDTVVDLPKPAQQQQEVQFMAIPAPVLQAAITLIDEEVNGKKGRRLANLLEQAQPINITKGD